MHYWAITLISIFSTIIGLYLIGFICSLIFARLFSKRIKNRINSINLLLVEKKDIITSIDKALGNNKKYDESLNKLIEQVKELIELKITINEHKEVSDLLYKTSYKLTDYINKNNLNKNNSLNEFINSIKEINDSYRQNVAILNSNIVGYNYWISLAAYKFYFHLRKKYPLDKFE